MVKTKDYHITLKTLEALCPTLREEDIIPRKIKMLKCKSALRPGLTYVSALRTVTKALERKIPAAKMKALTNKRRN